MVAGGRGTVFDENGTVLEEGFEADGASAAFEACSVGAGCWRCRRSSLIPSKTFQVFWILMLRREVSSASRAAIRVFLLSVKTFRGSSMTSRTICTASVAWIWLGFILCHSSMHFLIVFSERLFGMSRLLGSVT